MEKIREFIRKHFNLIYLGFSVIALVVVTLRCYFVPIAHDEVATFFYYVQPEKFIPFHSHIDANGHFLNSFLIWVCYKLFGSSMFVLRLPCIFAFLVLAFSIYKFNNQLLTSTKAKAVLTACFIQSFNILNFYSLARGYGLSIAFLVLALFYFFRYLKSFSWPDVFKFILFSQVALSANLTLVFTLLVTTAVIMFFQIRDKTFFSAKNIILLLIHFSLILFWIKYAFFLQANGALYYGGGGGGYWKVTFVSLIETVLGQGGLINTVVIILFAFLFVMWLWHLSKERLTFLFQSNFAICFFCLALLIVAFYLLNRFFGVNYPEDRTGLFFYIFFVLSIVFFSDEYIYGNIGYVFISIPIFFITNFVIDVNFGKHAWKFYETMPKDFYTILTEEQKKNPNLISVGGHRVLEFFYTFYNYNNSEKLNHMLPPEHMTMNCDYYVTWRKDRPWYEKYYTELKEAKYWDMVLLKRKTPAERKLVYEGGEKIIEGTEEYYPFFERTDTTFTSRNSIMAEFDLSVEEAARPFNAWLVLQVDTAGGQNAYFRRTPLNWIKYDWNGTKHYKTCIVTDNVPLTKCRVVAFLWNIDKKPVRAKLHSFKLYTLQGEGITEVSHAKE